jgi:hypothetical protein
MRPQPGTIAFMMAGPEDANAELLEYWAGHSQTRYFPQRTNKHKDGPILLRPLYKLRARSTHNVSEEGRDRIAEAQKKRWAAAKRAK